MNLASPLEEVILSWNSRFRLFLKRDDLIHPEIQGNKWRKLLPFLPVLSGQCQYSGALSFGGPFSNHLHALAAAGRSFDFLTAGIVRGLASNMQNPTLLDARNWGMRLFPVSKRDYEWLKKAALSEIFRFVGFQPEGQYLLLPEGGDTPESLVACKEIAAEIAQQLPGDAGQPVYIAVPAGTGCTAAGVVAGATGRPQVLIFPAAPYGVDEAGIRARLERAGEPEGGDFQIVMDKNARKFAQMDDELRSFVQNFYRETGVLPDPVYTSKMMSGIQQLAEQEFFPTGSCVVALFTGGLQGWRGMKTVY